jgi:coenzyme F420-reducing hydrogenase delta subunit
VLHALDSGFDGVFIAADGGDCSYISDCTERTGKVVQQAQELLQKEGYDPSRLKMAAICSVCSQAFVSHIVNFCKDLNKLNESGSPKTEMRQ